MRLFLRIVRLAIQQQMTYRMALLAGLVTNLFFGLLRAFVLVALYQGRGEVNELTLRGAITYVAFSQGMIAFLTIFGSFDVMQSVYTGSIGADLLKPMPLFWLWMGRDLGRSLVNLFGRGILLMLLFVPFFAIQLPSGSGPWLAMIAAMLLGWLVSFAWRFLTNLAAFWSPDARGIGRIAFTASQFLSGFMMPLRLYPDWFQQICNMTPFPTMFNTSVEAYLGLVTGPQLGLALLNQVVWFALLAGLSHLVLRAGVRRLVIQGG
jgi:ABC-2 type transport system permease protein